MDKVIDGIDVSECAYITYRDSDNPICSETGQYCKGYDICYYKQLMRARVEIERLEDTCNELRKRHSEDTTKLSAEVAELKAENERLKEENEQLVIRVANLNERFINGFNYNERRYKQALQEIREICKNSHTSASKDYYRTADKIQAKINEVIGAE